MTETSFPKYEIMLILQPDLCEEKTNGVLKEMKELITEAGGKVTHEDLWGLREMAYTIKKQKQGFYIVLNFTADPIKVKDFEKQLNIHQGVLRYLIQKTPKNYEIKTLAEYEEIAKEEALKAQEEAKEKAEKGDNRGGRNGANRRFERPEPPKKSEEKLVKKEKPAKEEEKEEKKPVKKVKKEEPIEETEEKTEKPKAKKQAATLEDVDAKLKSIIDDPDITL